MFNHARRAIPKVSVEIRVQSLRNFKGCDAVWHRNRLGSQLTKTPGETRARQCLIGRREQQIQSEGMIQGQTKASGSFNDASIESRSSCNAMQSGRYEERARSLGRAACSMPSHPNCSPPRTVTALAIILSTPRFVGSVNRFVDVLPDSTCPGIGCNSMGPLLLYRA
jgi:hypothetical protein